MATTAPNFHIANIPISGNLILAPMDGYSDLPFRSLARGFGSAMSYTEFINALEVIPRLQKRVLDRIAYIPQERPIVFQILDNDPDRILQAALKLREFNPDIIDVNMGCSARSVSARGAGAGLLRSPDKIARIFQLLTRNLDLPITGKIRLGWDAATENYLEIAKIIQDNGGQCIAVHGRTRQQAYSGNANWDAIAEIKQAVSIPVIANGDVCTVADIDKILSHTRCDAVMIGRAATTNPWIFKRLDRDQVPIEEIYQTLSQHLELNCKFYGEEFGLILLRKFAARYLGTYNFTKEQRINLLTCNNPNDFLQIAASLIQPDP